MKAADKQPNIPGLLLSRRLEYLSTNLQNIIDPLSKEEFGQILREWSNSPAGSAYAPDVTGLIRYLESISTQHMKSLQFDKAAPVELLLTEIRPFAQKMQTKLGNIGTHASALHQQVSSPSVCKIL